jgi:general secretion pathway protein I
MNASSTRGQRGFTLLEVMVAFVILAAALGLLLGMLSRGLRQVGQAQAETEASLQAQSLLDTVGTIEPIEPGTSTGEFGQGRYRWRMQVSEGADPAPPPPPADGAPAPEPAPALVAPLLYRVALDVEWGSERAQRLHFDTLRLRAPPAAQDGGAPAGAGAGASP